MPLANDNYRERAKEWAKIVKDNDARELAEAAAETMLRQGFELPVLKYENIKKTGNFFPVASYDFEDNTLTISNNKEIKKRGGLKVIGRQYVEMGWNAQDNPILHEMGHHIHNLLDKNAFTNKNKEVYLNKELVTKNLSRYAATKVGEFEAELISGILSGNRYEEAIMNATLLRWSDDKRAKIICAMGNGKAMDAIIKPGYAIKEELAFDKLMEFVYKQHGITPELFRKAEAIAFAETTASVLDQAMREGIRQTGMSPIMIQRLKDSNYVFSGFKTFHEMKETFPSLLDENGNKKPFKQFLKDVQAVNEKYNSHYLKAEYEFAVSSAEMAAKWEKFEEDGDRYDLQYRTMLDENVRDSHRKLDGVTLPPSSPFWNEYFPPNGWRCRCKVVQVRKGKYTTDEHEAMENGNQATAGKHQEMFRFNPGKQAACFPAYNPYTVSKCNSCPNGSMKLAADIPSNELCSSCRIIKEMKKANIKSARIAAKPLQGTSLSHSNMESEIIISGNSIKEWTNQPHKHFKEKNAMLMDIEKILSESRYIGMTDNHKNIKRVSGSHIFETELCGEKTWIIVREYDWGEMVLHSITDSDKILEHIKKK